MSTGGFTRSTDKEVELLKKFIREGKTQDYHNSLELIARQDANGIRTIMTKVQSTHPPGSPEQWHRREAVDNFLKDCLKQREAASLASGSPPTFTQAFNARARPSAPASPAPTAPKVSPEASDIAVDNSAIEQIVQQRLNQVSRKREAFISGTPERKFALQQILKEVKNAKEPITDFQAIVDKARSQLPAKDQAKFDKGTSDISHTDKNKDSAFKMMKAQIEDRINDLSTPKKGYKNR